MSRLLPILTDEEINRCPGTSEEAGFGSLATTRGHLPLTEMDVRARFDGLLSHLTLTQTFVNTHDEPLEATYVFPLPDRAAVVRFRMQVAGRVIEGQLQERGQARQAYDQAIQAGQRAAIAEEDRPNVFTLRVGNLMPGEKATVRLNLVGPLPYSDGEATFRFPLVVAPRYIPGRPLPGPSVGVGTEPDTDAVPDASRITPPVLLPGYPNPVRLSMTIDVYPSALRLGEFRCSLHSILEAADDAGVRRIILQPGERLNRDFILRFGLGEESVRSSLILKPDQAGGQEGTFALTLVPPVEPAQGQRPRDVVFILDRSGSMSGWKMVAARRALARMVETLTERDRFTVYAFDDRIETPPGFRNAGLAPATDRHRFLAAEFLGGIESRGGTEMAQPLDLAVHTLKEVDAQRERILVLVTDGQVGNEDQILHNLGQRVRHIRIFTLGIDQAVNEGFLRRLGSLGRGACELVESEQRLEQVMEQVHRHIGTPVLTGLHLEPKGFQIAPDTQVPGRMPDLFAGTPLSLMGRYFGAAEATLTLRAHDAAGQSWSATVPAEVRDNPAIGSVWARGYIRELEDRFAVAGGDPQLEKRIVATSLRFNVLCRFTAFVAVDRTASVNPGGQVHQVTQAVEKPAGWDEKCIDLCSLQYLDDRLSELLDAGIEEEQMRLMMDPRAAKKTRQAKQVRRETNAGGRITKKTELALDNINRDAEKAPPAQDGTNGITQLTDDHSLSQALVEAKTITPAEAGEQCYRNVLWKFLGSKEVGTGPEVKELPVCVGDRFLLCTDGLTCVSSDDQLLRMLVDQQNVQTCADTLGKLALDSGSRDNVSCIVVQINVNETLTVGQCTLQGNDREHNEDRIAVAQFSDWTVCLVADGMGTKGAGAIASQRAVDVILRELRQHLIGAVSGDQVKDALRKAIVLASDDLIALGSLDPNVKNIGSTVVLSAWRKGSAVMFVTSVGDSRCYHVSRANDA